VGYVGASKWDSTPIGPGLDGYIEERVNDKITHLYETGLQALPRDALALLRKPKEQILKHHFTAKEEWIESVEVAMHWKT